MLQPLLLLYEDPVLENIQYVVVNIILSLNLD